MNSGQAATANGITPKMIRHYEQIGGLPLPLPPAMRLAIAGMARRRYAHWYSSDAPGTSVFLWKRRAICWPCGRTERVVALRSRGLRGTISTR